MAESEQQFESVEDLEQVDFHDKPHINLIRFREAAGLTQQQVAERVGVKQNTYSDWEKTAPPFEVALEVALELGVPPQIAAIFEAQVRRFHSELRRERRKARRRR